MAKHLKSLRHDVRSTTCSNKAAAAAAGTAAGTAARPNNNNNNHHHFATINAPFYAWHANRLQALCFFCRRDAAAAGKASSLSCPVKLRKKDLFWPSAN